MGHVRVNADGRAEHIPSINAEGIHQIAVMRSQSYCVASFPEGFHQEGSRKAAIVEPTKNSDGPNVFCLDSFAQVAGALAAQVSGKPYPSSRLKEIERRRFDQSFRAFPLYGELGGESVMSYPVEHFWDGEQKSSIDLPKAFAAAHDVMQILLDPDPQRYLYNPQKIKRILGCMVDRVEAKI